MSAATDLMTSSNSPEDLNLQQPLYDKLKIRKLFKHNILHVFYKARTRSSKFLFHLLLIRRFIF
jgi:hypothetical protein